MMLKKTESELSLLGALKYFLKGNMVFATSGLIIYLIADKVAKAGFTITPSPNVDAPIINEYKLTLECKVVTFDEDENGGARVVGEIVNMSADESILDEAGNIDLGKLQPVIFYSAKNEYRVVGEKVGTAWGSGKAIQEREVK